MRKLLNICLLVLLIGLSTEAGAQVDSVRLKPHLSTLRPSMLPPRDSLGHDTVVAALSDTLATIPDSAAKVADSLLKATDSTAMPIIPNSPSALTSIVHYKAADSIAIDINKRKAQLYNKGVIEYDGMELTANDIRVDFNKQTLSAQPVSDTNGKPTGRPFFKQGDDEYMADTIVFNYNTHKGLISGVITSRATGFSTGRA